MDRPTCFVTSLLNQYVQLDTVKTLNPPISASSPSIFLSQLPSETDHLTVIANELLQMNHPDYAICPQAVVPVLRGFLNEISILQFLGPTNLALPLRGFSIIAGFGCFSPRLFIKGDFSGTLYAALLLNLSRIRDSLDSYISSFVVPMVTVLALLHSRGIPHGCVSTHSIYVPDVANPVTQVRIGNFGGCAPSSYRPPRYHWGKGPGHFSTGDPFERDIYGIGMIIEALIGHWLQLEDERPERTRHWKALAERCTADEPSRRPSISEVMDAVLPGENVDRWEGINRPVLLPESDGEIDSISQLIAMFVDRSADNAGEPVAPIDVAVVVGKFLKEDPKMKDRQSRNAVIRTMSQCGPRSSLVLDGHRR